MAIVLILVFTSVALLVYLYYQKVYRFNKYLRRFVCPPEKPILGHALDFLYKNHLEVLMKYTENYGDMVHVKVGPKRHLLFTSNYDLIEFVLTNTNILEKSMDYRNLNRWLGTGLLTGAGAKWKKHRRVLTPTFHYKILEDFVEVFEKNSKILCQQFEKEIEHNLSTDIYPFITRCTLDIICESAMGTSVHAQVDKESSYVKSCNTMCEIIIERAFSPYKVFDLLYYFTDDFKREIAALKILHGYSKSVISKRQSTVDVTQSPSKKKKAFLDLLLEANAQEHLTFEEICQEVDTFMFAGHHTTASAISFILYSLAQYPEIQERVINEQRDIFSDDFNTRIDLQQLKNMKYLEMVIKESLRLYPSVPFYARELSEDTLYDGEILPKGLTITMFVYALHRNPKYFSDPLTFNPSRFEQSQHNFSYLPFSAGSRNCIGQKFAMAEMKSIVSRVVQKFELLPDPHHELKLASEVVLTSHTGFCINLKKRQLF